MFVGYGLLGLAVPVAAIAAFFMVLNLRRRLSAVEVRLRNVERRLIGTQAAFEAPTPWRSSSTGTTDQEPPPTPQATEAEAPQPMPVPGERAEEPAAPAEVPPPSPTTPPSPHPPEQASRPPSPQPPSFEERFGTSWVVWAGGIALALGGIFLVQYSIERGLLGPGARVFLGALLAAALVAASEWLRRGERRPDLVGLPAAHIPSILTAAGTTVAYATAYAAYALYGFLGPAGAFVLLGAVALATLAAALLHGPALAALGLVGAFVAPLLVSTTQPNYWALTIYLGVVTAASFAMALARHWRWLVVTTIAFGVLWMLPGILETSQATLSAHAAHAAIGFVLAAIFVVSGFLLGPDAEPGRVERISSGALSAYLFAAALLVVAQNHDVIPFAVFAALVAGAVWIAFQTDAAAGAVPAAAVLVALVMFDWALDLAAASGIVPAGPSYYSVVEPQFAANQAHLVVGTGFAILFGLAGYLAQGRSARPLAPMLWAASAVGAPLAILIALYVRIADFERSIPFAAAALLLAALFAAATDRLASRAPRPGNAAATAIFASGSVAGLALGLTLALEKGWLSVSFALMVPAVAWIGQKRSLPALRWVAAALVGLVLARVAWEPRIVGGDLGATPIFNWLLWGYGVPAVSFWLAGAILRRRADDIPARMADSAAILFTVLLTFLEIRHFMTGGDIYADDTSLGDVGLQISAALAMAIGLERVRARTSNKIHDIGALVIAGLAIAAIPVRLVILENPLMNPVDVGGPFINLILLCYGLPAILVGALGFMTRGTRPDWYRVTAAVIAVALALLYLSLQVRRLFQGPVLTFGDISDAEQYTYSVVWLCFGIVLLFAGIALRSQPVRLASAAVVLATVGKVFLIDMGDLTGGFRALSFIGLGLVLVAIGWLYQKLLFPRRTAAPAEG